jgi:hypothetical protein
MSRPPVISFITAIYTIEKGYRHTHFQENKFKNIVKPANIS